MRLCLKSGLPPHQSEAFLSCQAYKQLSNTSLFTLPCRQVRYFKVLFASVSCSDWTELITPICLTGPLLIAVLRRQCNALKVVGSLSFWLVDGFLFGIVSQQFYEYCTRGTYNSRFYSWRCLTCGQVSRIQYAWSELHHSLLSHPLTLPQNLCCRTISRRCLPGYIVCLNIIRHHWIQAVD